MSMLEDIANGGAVDSWMTNTDVPTPAINSSVPGIMSSGSGQGLLESILGSSGGGGSNIGSAIGTGIGAMFGGPAGAGIGSSLGGMLGGGMGGGGETSSATSSLGSFDTGIFNVSGSGGMQNYVLIGVIILLIILLVRK